MKHRKTRPGRVRIVAGKWRGRWVELAASAQLRPTPDRVRETLFNWLTPWIEGADVLDLFAGSGVLGLEALSRGARAATFVERDPDLVRALERNAQTLGAAHSATIVAADVSRFLRGPSRPMAIVFADPPYAAARHGELCTLLQSRSWLAQGALVYLEQQAGTEPPDLPAGFSLMRSKTAGQVQYMLLRYEAETGPPPGE